MLYTLDASFRRTIHNQDCYGKCPRQRRRFARCQAHLGALASAARDPSLPGSLNPIVSDAYIYRYPTCWKLARKPSQRAAAHLYLPIVYPRTFTDLLRVRQFCPYDDSRNADRLESSTSDPPDRELPATLLKFVTRGRSSGVLPKESRFTVLRTGETGVL